MLRVPRVLRVLCMLRPGTSIKSASNAVHKLLESGVLGSLGFSWRSRGTEAHEVEVSGLMA